MVLVTESGEEKTNVKGQSINFNGGQAVCLLWLTSGDAGLLLAFNKNGVAKLPEWKAEAGKRTYTIELQDIKETFHVVAQSGPPASFGRVQIESLGSDALNTVFNREPFILLFEVSNSR